MTFGELVNEVINTTREVVEDLTGDQDKKENEDDKAEVRLQELKVQRTREHRQ